MSKPETMAEIRQRANSHDGCPPEIFDLALAAHDAEVERKAKAEGWDEGKAAGAEEAYENLPGYELRNPYREETTQ